MTRPPLPLVLGLVVCTLLLAAPSARAAGCTKHRNCNNGLGTSKATNTKQPKFCNARRKCKPCSKCTRNSSINGVCPRVCTVPATPPPPSPPATKANDPTVAPGCTLQQGMDYAGNNLLKASQKFYATLHECSQACLQRVDCVGFTRLKNGRCYLKSSTAGRKARKQAVSGLCGGGNSGGSSPSTPDAPVTTTKKAKETTGNPTTKAPTTAPDATGSENRDTSLPGECMHDCNPGKSWADSYQVNGRCYCMFGAHSFDHGIGDVLVETPVGRRSVRQVCSNINQLWGGGPSAGRVYYNTVNCGNPPYNNAGDEDRDACPGRVDMGSGGCRLVGPAWDLATLYRTRS